MKERLEQRMAAVETILMNLTNHSNQMLEVVVMATAYCFL
jgi:hypothetical protein